MSLLKKIFEKIDVLQVKTFISYLPFIAIFFPVLGFFYSVAYYLTFQINITRYISFGEIFTLQSFELLKIIIFLVLWFMVFYFADKTTIKRKWLTIILIVTIVLNLLLPLFGKFTIPLFQYDEILVQKVFIFYYFSYGLIAVIELKTTSPQIDKNLLLIYLILSFIIISYQSGRESGQYLLKKFAAKDNSVFTFTDGSIIKASKDTIFLGQTTSFIFFYSTNDSSKLIFNKSNLTSLKYK